MGKFSGFLLASDFDGTLADSNGEISADVREALHYFLSQGGMFTVCTGRTKQGFHKYAPDIVNAPVLLANGIMAYDYGKEKTVFCCGIERGDAMLVPALLERFPSVCIELYSADFRSYAIRLNDRSRNHFLMQDICWNEIEDVREANTPFVKIMLSCGGKCAREVQRWLDGEIGKYDLKYIPSTGEYVEIIRKEADKGQGLLRLASLLGIDKRHVYAVGDGENDVDMLKAAAVGFAPENGSAAAVAVADVTVRGNDSGAVAHVIELLDAGSN